MEEVVNYLEDTIKTLMAEINDLAKKLADIRVELAIATDENKALKELLETYKEWDHIK
jgi:regulator of replication initiation timing